MKIICAFTLILILSVKVSAQSLFFEKTPEGWHWNNMQKMQKHKKNREKEKAISVTKSNSDNPIVQMSAIHKALEIAKDRAVLNPSVKNIRDYLLIQHMITEQSTRFAQNWQKTLLLYPEFDYNLKHPVDASENQAYQSHLYDVKVQITKQLSQRFGLFYFYRGDNVVDQVMSKTVVQFANWYHFSLIGISVDHKGIADIQNNRINQGQMQQLKVKALPALVLVNPKTGAHMILSYGYASNDELLTSCLNLTSDFKGLS